MFDFHSGLIRHTTVKMNVTGRSFMRWVNLQEAILCIAKIEACVCDPSEFIYDGEKMEKH